MWIDSKECVPIADGFYLVQTVYGQITGYTYTLEGGWNTIYDTHGVLYKDSAIECMYVARWYDAPKPDAVPKAWVDEYTELLDRKVVNK